MGHTLLKKITEHADILTWNENGEAVIYGNAIPGSNFKSLFKSMVSNQQNLNQVGIDKFLRALRSLGVNKDYISGEPLKIKYRMWRPIAPTSVTRHQLSMRMKRKMMKKKTYARQVISIELIKTRKHHLQACHRIERAMFTSHPGASQTFSMFINLIISLSLTISFHFIYFILFYSHFN